MWLPQHHSSSAEQRGGPKAAIGLWKLLGKDKEDLSPAEEKAVSSLSVLHRRLPVEGGRVNTKSEAGFNACAAFLDKVASVAAVMRLETAPRRYRETFTVNYRSLFPDEARNYRIDVLEASADQYAMIWVNGEKFEFTEEAMHRAEALQRCWLELGALLERWSQATEQPWWSSRPCRTDLRGALVALDLAWAGFEQRYISELIGIEEKARGVVSQASERERLLQLHEARAATRGATETLWQRQDYLEAHERLAALVARLNSVANHRRRGRDDLSSHVVVGAADALRRCDAAELSGEATEATRAARILALSVMESFSELRGYLREVTRCMERVDPHLCNNIGLVNKLADWEEKWEIGRSYVQDETVLAAVCGVVERIREAQGLVPALATMCSECDVELFLVLPRIMWLCFLEAPDKYARLLQFLLPQHFEGPDRRLGDEISSLVETYRTKFGLLSDACRVPEDAGRSAPSSEQQASTPPGGAAPAPPTRAKGTLMASQPIKGPLHFSGKLRQHTQRLLLSARGATRAEARPSAPPAAAPPAPVRTPEQVARELLLRHAVVSEGQAAAVYQRLPPCEGRDRAQAAAEELMRELERWSIMLQRHCPDDFNQCCAILMQCLSGESNKQEAPGAFQV